MFIRIVTVAFLGLVSITCFSQAIDWPPKAVPKQQTGKVPDFKEKNALCLDCHKEILEVKTSRKNVSNAHNLHLNSKKVAYEGKNRDCLTCHEMVIPSETKAKKKEGWFVKGDVYHNNVLQNPRSQWKKQVVRAEDGVQYLPVETLRQTEPHPYKPTLKRLVCAECHGPDSKIKTFYGMPLAAK